MKRQPGARVEEGLERMKRRKEEHLRICLEREVEATGVSNGFERFRLLHQALPELNLDEIDLSLSLFGKPLKAPLLISPMTGGFEEGARINRNLAQAAQALGLGMGLGSQRIALAYPEVASTFQVRDLAPDILLIANLGAAQLNYGYGLEECRKVVQMVGADALALHLNPLQEAWQPEGRCNFRALKARIAQVCRQLPFPVIAKEVGWGISREVALHLKAAGVKGIDVAGAGGTNWFLVEKYRLEAETQRHYGLPFLDWGIPTADSLRMVHEVAPELTILASGGIRTGVEVAKALCLGAKAVGIGRPLLEPATHSAQAVQEKLEGILHELRIAMFCLGVSHLGELAASMLLPLDPNPPPATSR